jgi:hypothetical protein
MKRRYSKKRRQHGKLHRLFGALADRIEDYDSPPHDTGYWYGERALTGFLAAAAWSLPNGWSLEEFTGLRVNGKKNGSGRGDLWVGIGKKSYTIEAKAVWPGSNVENAIKGAKAKLSDASSQLRQLHKSYRVGKPLALCYIIPALNRKGKFAGSKSIKDFFTEMPKKLSDPRTAVVALWYEQKPPRHSGHIYPGVIVVARILPSWNKGNY